MVSPCPGSGIRISSARCHTPFTTGKIASRSTEITALIAAPHRSRAGRPQPVPSLAWSWRVAPPSCTSVAERDRQDVAELIAQVGGRLRGEDDRLVTRCGGRDIDTSVIAHSDQYPGRLAVLV